MQTKNIFLLISVGTVTSVINNNKLIRSRKTVAIKGSIQVISDPDPGGLKIYGSGSGTLFRVYSKIPVRLNRLFTPCLLPGVFWKPTEQPHVRDVTPVGIQMWSQPPYTNSWRQYTAVLTTKERDRKFKGMQGFVTFFNIRYKAVLRICDVYYGYRIRIFPSRIPDPGSKRSRIPDPDPQRI